MKQSDKAYPKTMSEEILARLISDLPLTQKLEMKKADKRLNQCLDQILATEQTITLVDTYGGGLDVWMNRHKNRIELKKIGRNFNDNNHWMNDLMNKLPNIRHVVLDNNIRIDNQMLEWLLNRWPRLDSLSLLDYRLNYHKFDWELLGDNLSERLVYLQIECRLIQHISGSCLAQLVSKIKRLEELTIVSPNRRLELVFTCLGPTIRKLSILESKHLDSDEINALVNGNGRHLEELTIQYRCSVVESQDYPFAMICQYLLNLKSLSFNHPSLSPEALSRVVRLTNLNKFKYNFNGTAEHNLKFAYGFRTVELRCLSKTMTNLKSLTLSNIYLLPQYMYNWKDLFPNMRHLYLKCLFDCGCLPIVNMNHCDRCLQLCFTYISQLSSLRSLTLAEPLNILALPFFIFLCKTKNKLQSLEINMCRCNDYRHFQNSVLPTLVVMANNRNAPLSVRLYDMNFDPTPKLKKSFPRNLKITFIQENEK